MSRKEILPATHPSGKNHARKSPSSQDDEDEQANTFMLDDNGTGDREWWEKQEWCSHTVIKVTPDGKHSPPFPDEFPLMLFCYDFRKNFRLTPSYHDYLEIVYTYTGDGLFTIEDRIYHIRKGDVVVIGNTEFHVLEKYKGTDLRTISFYFLPELIYNPGGNILNFDYLKPFFDHSVEFMHLIPADTRESRKVSQLLKRISIELKSKREHYQLASITYLYELLLVLVRYYNRFSGSIKKYNQKKANIERLNKVFLYLQEKYQEKITLKEVAEIACMSSSYFCNFFKNVTGYTLTDYIARLRIDKAKELLLQGSLSITQIGYEVGFENHSYFDKVFKKLQGISPLEFRKQFA